MKNNKHKNTAKHRHVSKNAQVKMKNRGKENPYVASRLRQLELHCYYNDCAEPFPELKQVCIAREHPDGTMTYLYLGMQDRMGIIENFKTEISIDRQRFDDLLQYFKLRPFNDVMALERLIYDTRACQAFWMLPLPKQLPMALGMLSHKQNKVQKAKRLATFQEVQANIAIVENSYKKLKEDEVLQMLYDYFKNNKNNESYHPASQDLIFANHSLPQGVIDALIGDQGQQSSGDDASAQPMDGLSSADAILITTNQLDDPKGQPRMQDGSNGSSTGVNTDPIDDYLITRKKEFDDQIKELIPTDYPDYDPSYCKDWSRTDWDNFVEELVCLEKLPDLHNARLFTPLLYMFFHGLLPELAADSLVLEELDFLGTHPAETGHEPNFDLGYKPSIQEVLSMSKIQQDFRGSKDINKRRKLCKKLEEVNEQYPENPYIMTLLHDFYWDLEDGQMAYRQACRMYNSSKDREQSVVKYFMEICKNNKKQLLEQFLKKSVLLEKHLPEGIKSYNLYNYHHYYHTLATYYVRIGHWSEFTRLMDIFINLDSTRNDFALSKLWKDLYAAAAVFMCVQVRNGLEEEDDDNEVEDEFEDYADIEDYAGDEDYSGDDVGVIEGAQIPMNLNIIINNILNAADSINN